MAFMPSASHYNGVEMFQKGDVQSVFAPSLRSNPQDDELDETDFEDEDSSDFDDYSGRRSEESFGNRSNTTVSTFEELRTPASNNFKSFNFHLPSPEKEAPIKPVEGPIGPHLFRVSRDVAQERDAYLQWSPVSPEEQRAGPQVKTYTNRRSMEAEVPPSSIPLQMWTPQQVACWMRAVGLEESIIAKFRKHDISGDILKDLSFGDLKELGIELFGQRHKLWNEIRTLRGRLSLPQTQEQCHSPLSPDISAAPLQATRERRSNECSNPSSPEGDGSKPSAGVRRRARRALRPDDVISPGESASIVAIEQLLPKPHHCKKGESCPTWQKRQRKLARIAKEFPMELEQLEDANTSPNATVIRPISEAQPSVVASSDLLGPGRLPSLRINEEALSVVQTRDPQENVRQFLSFQHLDERAAEEPTTPPYEMFPPLSPPQNTQAPHNNLSKLPKLTIPSAQPREIMSPNRTAVRPTRTPVTAMDLKDRSSGHDIYRFGSPASAMDVPVTAIPIGPIARDESQSVPPDMRFGEDPIQRSNSQFGHRRQPWSPIIRPSTSHSIERSASRASHRRQPAFAMSPVEERHFSPADEEKTPTTLNDINHAGWMKKRKTKMLRHEWHENHFRLKGTTLAMHRDSKALDALEYIDVDDYAVMCSTMASNNKLNAALKSLKLSKKDRVDDSAFSFQLIPAAEKKGILSSATGKTHHFAVKTQDERIDWMRELLLAQALRQKTEGCEININGNVV